MKKQVNSETEAQFDTLLSLVLTLLHLPPLKKWFSGRVIACLVCIILMERAGNSKKWVKVLLSIRTSSAQILLVNELKQYRIEKDRSYRIQYIFN
jgi:hypothetical protein